MAKSKNVPPVDAIYLHMETPDNLMYVTGVLLLDQPVDLAALKQLVNDRFLKFGRFQQKLKPTWWAFSDWRWVDDPAFNIDNHIWQHQLPAPNDQAVLQEAVSDLVSQPLDMTIPLWQLDVLNGFGDGCAIIVRVHHSIADGIALVFVLLSILDSQNGLAIPGMGKQGLLKRIGQFFGRLFVLSKFPFTARRMLKQPIERPTVLRGELGTQKRVIWMDALSLAEVKAVGKAHGGTINDLLLTVLAGSLRNYLAARGEPVDTFEIHAVVPVGMRRLEKSADLGNVIGAVTLALPINIAEPLERLRVLKKRMDKLKRSPEAWISYRASKIIGILPKKRAANIITNARSKTSMLVSNVPGAAH